MAKGKKSADESAAKKTAKKSTAKKAAPNKAVAEKIAATPPEVPVPLSSAPLRTAPPAAAQLYEEIRRRAYEFYRERGGQHGSHEADWHRAESEVRSKYR
jgi:hypothetical protein